MWNLFAFDQMINADVGNAKAVIDLLCDLDSVKREALELELVLEIVQDLSRVTLARDRLAGDDVGEFEMFDESFRVREHCLENTRA